MKFKKVSEPIITDDVYYDLFEGGYISPNRMLIDDQDKDDVAEAIYIVKTFLEEAQNQGVLFLD